MRSSRLPFARRRRLGVGAVVLGFLVGEPVRSGRHDDLAGVPLGKPGLGQQLDQLVGGEIGETDRRGAGR